MIHYAINNYFRKQEDDSRKMIQMFTQIYRSFPERGVPIEIMYLLLPLSNKSIHLTSKEFCRMS